MKTDSIKMCRQRQKD